MHLVRRRGVSLSLVGTLTFGILASSACDSNSNASKGSCPTGDEKCACFSNSTCNSGLACMSDVCVLPSGTGTGGATSSPDTNLGGNTQTGDTSSGGSSQAVGTGGAQSTGGASQSDATGGALATGGAPQTGGATGGAMASGGAAPAGGAPQTGGAASAGGATQAATGGATQAATGGAASTGGATQSATGGALATGGMPATGGTSSVNNSPVIDAFASCDNKIESNGGRKGEWYAFADDDINATHGFSDPGTQWADHGCSAWFIAGCTGTACTYAGIGFQLSAGDPYDLSSHDGVSIAMESGSDVYFVVKTSNGGYFGTWLTATTGNQTRNADFVDLAKMSDSAASTLNTALITEMQFTIGAPLQDTKGAGFAIHSVSLY